MNTIIESLDDFFLLNSCDDKTRAVFDGYQIRRIIFHKKRQQLELYIHFNHSLPFNAYKMLEDYFSYNVVGQHIDTKLYISCEDKTANVSDIISYLKDGNLAVDINFTPVINGEECFLIVEDEKEVIALEMEIKQIKHYLSHVGIEYEYIAKVENYEQPKMSIELEAKTKEVQKPIVSIKQPASKYQRKKVETKIYKIKELNESVYNCLVEAKVFKLDLKETKNGKVILSLEISDGEDAIVAKMFEGGRSNITKEMITSIKVGDGYRFNCNYGYDNFMREYNLTINAFEKIDLDHHLVDDEEIKRVELDVHSNRSEMDGVCEVSELINAAFEMGHRGMALTDHMNVQGFPLAQKEVAKLLKKHPDREFKVMYGVQFNLVEEKLKIVRNPINKPLRDLEYVVFDLETTGLSAHYDHIIEFGAVVFKNGLVLERHDFFVKPPVDIPSFIQSKTHITNSDVADALTFKQCADRLLAIFKDRVLVAHNASFDYGFLNDEFMRIGYPKLDNPVIDTLDLARSLFKNRRSYRLGNMARLYHVSYDEDVAHRADYDAEVLGHVFNFMLMDIEKHHIFTLDALANFQSADAFVKNFASYANVLAKNKAGLKDLFKLVSISHTEELAVFGKANTKSTNSDYVAEPRMFKRTLDEYRQHLLIGSSTSFGEVFDAAAYRSQSDLERAIAYFDYIEVQPLELYRPLLESYKILNEDRLKDIIKRIIKTAKDLGKIVVATGDVHYVYENQRKLRDVYINAQGIGGTRHPLFIYDRNRRMNAQAPLQHYLNTRQMKEAFAYLEDEDLIDEIVVKNPNLILDSCETLYPIHKGLFPPNIANSDELLTNIVYDNAHKLYGDELDPIIKARIEKELNSIISNGYGVIYYVSHLLVKKSNEDGYLVGSRGSVGSSIVATLSGITEVNPLKPHYRCPKCKHLEWVDDTFSGYNLPDKKCPVCASLMLGDGQDIPFETFLGFEGDKVPDIDLNFSSEYQDKAHLFTREVFGEDHVFRAGTISTVAEKTAFGYVKGYFEEMGQENVSRAKIDMLAAGCQNVKRTTGQHPGGIIVIPQDKDVYDFTPVQYPANDLNSVWKTTHFDFHEIHDNVLKFDILGHVDPTAMRLLQNISDIDPKSIPMNDPAVMSIFNSAKALKIVNSNYQEETGACGLPEFGTRFVRGILELTRPDNFSDLVQISGLSHGTDVWNNNAKDLIENNGIKLKDVIGCRDDIMSTLLRYGLEPKNAFTIMECVRKGKGLTDDQEKDMSDNGVPKWYIDSCKKIKYMFPKAHAVAYVIMAIRIAWFKVHHPIFYYISYFSLRCDAYEIETMIKDAEEIKARMDEIEKKKNEKNSNNPITKKEKDLYDVLEISYEMACRGYRMTNIDLKLSLATKFRINPYNDKEIIPPFVVLDGLGDAVAESIVDARNEHEFISKEDLMNRTQISKTLKERLDSLGVLIGLEEQNQLSLF
ncbi:MAG: PolC-type DNA polymerase III [Erysipelotrichaceae bacterium]|nr:PolC-type DNA polymerase III [Erysipelotrichaceae bacterium]